MSKLESDNAEDQMQARIAQQLSAHLLSQEKVQNSLMKDLQHYRSILEKQDWEERKNRIIVKGKQFSAENLLVDVNNFLNTHFGVEGAATTAKPVSRPGSKPIILVTLASWEVKQNILRNKRTALKGINVYIEPDLLPSERKVNQKLRARAKTERANGNEVFVKQRAIKVNSDWYVWDELSDGWKPSTRNRDRNTEPQPNQQNAKNTNKSAAASSLSGTPMD